MFGEATGCLVEQAVSSLRCRLVDFSLDRGLCIQRKIE